MVYYGVLVRNECSSNDSCGNDSTNRYVYSNEGEKMTEEEFKESFDVKTVFIVTTLMIISFVVGNYFHLFEVFGF